MKQPKLEYAIGHEIDRFQTPIRQIPSTEIASFLNEPVAAVAVSDTRHSVERGRVPDGMLAASHRIMAGHAGVWYGLSAIAVSSPAWAWPYARPATLIQASFLLLRLGGWCPPGGTPSVDKALWMFLVVNPICCNASMHCAFSSFGRLRHPVVGSDHVISVWVVPQEFDHVAGEGRREFVMSHETGQGPGSVAGEPPGTHATPLE